MTLYRIGEQVGMSFQLKDDWLDVFGEPGKTGKRQGGDILRGKKTALVHVAMEGAGSSDRHSLADWYHPEHPLPEGTGYRADHRHI
ncbi:MAG: polyprenyl synthetase family protein [Saprospiraceae bacterium]